MRVVPPTVFAPTRTGTRPAPAEDKGSTHHQRRGRGDREGSKELFLVNPCCRAGEASRQFAEVGRIGNPQKGDQCLFAFRRALLDLLPEPIPARSAPATPQ